MAKKRAKWSVKKGEKWDSEGVKGPVTAQFIANFIQTCNKNDAILLATKDANVKKKSYLDYLPEIASTIWAAKPMIDKGCTVACGAQANDDGTFTVVKVVLNVETPLIIIALNVKGTTEEMSGFDDEMMVPLAADYIRTLYAVQWSPAKRMPVTA